MAFPNAYKDTRLTIAPICEVKNVKHGVEQLVPSAHSEEDILKANKIENYKPDLYSKLEGADCRRG